MNDLIKKESIQDFKIDWKYYLQTFLITQSGLSTKTIAAYRTAVVKFLTYMNDNGIERPLPDDIHQYQGYLKEIRFSIFSINLYMVSLKKFFHYLHQPYKSVGAASVSVYPDIYAVAAPKVKRPDRNKHYREMPTQDAITALRGALIDSVLQKDQRDLLMIDLGLYCGCRVNEIANIKVSDLVKDGDNHRLYLLRKNSTAKISSVFIDVGIVTRIKAYIETYNIQNYLFTDLSHVQAGKKGHLCSTTISTIITKHMKRAEVKKDTITAHSLRHSAGTTYYQATKDIYATQVFMGHNDSQTTAIYMHVANNYEAAGIALAPVPA